MKVLTDTHTLVWALSDPAALGAASARRARRITLYGERRQFLGVGAQVAQAGRAGRRPTPLVGKIRRRTRIPTLAIRTAHIRGWRACPNSTRIPSTASWWLRRSPKG